MIFEEYNEQKAMEAAKKHAEKRFNEGVEQGKIEKQNALIKRMFEKKMGYPKFLVEFLWFSSQSIKCLVAIFG